MMIFSMEAKTAEQIVIAGRRKIHKEFDRAEENWGENPDSPEEKWSGLSESNRHLNLGKVPYYHYTKAAQRPSFYNTVRQSATSGLIFALRKAHAKTKSGSGNLSDPDALDDGRSALAVGKAVCLCPIGIDAAKLFAVRIIDADEKMMMLATTIQIVRCSASACFVF
jgi:hypothetical protein